MTPFIKEQRFELIHPNTLSDAGRGCVICQGVAELSEAHIVIHGVIPDIPLDSNGYHVWLNGNWKSIPSRLHTIGVCSNCAKKVQEIKL